MKKFFVPFFSLLTIISFCPLVFSQQCKNFDLRQKLGSVLNQGDTTWCFAYAASELVSHKLGQRVSPIDMATKFHKTTDRRNRDSIIEGFNRGTSHGEVGFAHDTIKYMNDVGFCPYDKTGLNSSENTADLAGSFNNLNDLIFKNYSLHTASREECKKIESVQKVFPGVSLEEIQRVAEEEVIIDVTSTLADKACGQKIKSKNPLVVSITPNKFRGFVPLTDLEFQKVTKVLDKNQPVVISVNMELFQKQDDPTEHSKHAMTIVGRKFNPKTGECEYIIRNSWGPECLSNYLVDCEDGNLIVSESLLRAAMYRATHIE